MEVSIEGKKANTPNGKAKPDEKPNNAQNAPDVFPESDGDAHSGGAFGEIMNNAYV